LKGEAAGLRGGLNGVSYERDTRYLIFGSRVMDTKTGIILNDEMDDFSTPGLPDAFGR
jgi:gamma-glutamyltranspeptidase